MERLLRACVLQSEAIAALVEERARLQGSLQEVAATLQDTVDHLESEIAHRCQLEEAMQRMDERITYRDRCATCCPCTACRCPALST